MSDTEWDSDAEKDYGPEEQQEQQEQQEDTREDNGVLIRYCYCSENAKSYPQTMTLPCSHVVHTQCFFNRLMEFRDLPCDILCLRCGTAAAEPMPQYRLLTEQQTRDRLRDLWSSNEQFRTDVRAILEARKVFVRHSSKYKPQRTIVVRRFKEAVKLSVAYIKDQVRASKAELRAIPSAALFKRADNAFRKKMSALRAAYNVWNLDDLNQVEGAPRIPRRMRAHMYYRRSPFYIRI